MNIFGMTDVGRRRTENQDAFIYEDCGEGLYIFVVCDGMGGAKAGNVAAEVAASVFMEQLRDHVQPKMSEKYARSVLLNAVNFANYEVYKRSVSDAQYEGMGTTLVGGYITGDEGVVTNIGDSRAYLISRERISRLTRDHSFVEELVDSGRITQEEARKHPHRNLITRALGTDKAVEADYYPFRLAEGECMLLCSDGLSGMVEDPVLQNLALEDCEIEEAVRKLVDEANQNGGSDNITVLLIRR